VLASGGRPGIASRLSAAAGAGFALATLGGYLLSVWTGLFGFKEVRTTAGLAAGVIEVAGFAVLAALAVAPARPDAPVNAPADGAAATPARFPAQIPPGMARAAAAAAAALAVAAAVLLGVAVAGTSPPAPAGTGTGLKTTVIGGVTVLTNGRGFTLYSFAPDTPTASKCYGSCAVYWPPVTGTAAASPGLPGRIATIARTGGSRQLTYNGHPLYTYIGDSAPGQARGNNLNLNGGLWHEVPVSRLSATAPKRRDLVPAVERDRAGKRPGGGRSLRPGYPAARVGAEIVCVSWPQTLPPLTARVCRSSACF
jgi:predicted lipoprotein with Yx(FWY)xxD motif